MRRGFVLLCALLLGGVTAALAANPTPPVVTTGTASGVTTNAATVAGTINPGGADATWQVEYGTSTGYGLTTAAQTLPAATTAQAVTAPLTRLTKSTTYHYRLTATNAAGITNGADKTFRTTTPPASPTVSTSTATAIGRNAATLRASVDANGQPTKYYFEFGTSRAYGQATPVADAGSSDSARTVSAQAAGLAPATTYHFRVVASSPAGTVRGGDRSFTTAKVPVSIAIGAAPDPLLYGRSLAIEGRLTGSGVAGRSVTLQSNPFPYTRGFRNAGSAHLTDATGTVRFTVAPFPAATQFRLSGAGARSAVVTVEVRPRISLHVRRIKGRRVRVTGAVLPGQATGVVSIQRRTASGRFVVLKRVALTHARYAVTLRYRPRLALRAALRSQGGPLLSAHSVTRRVS